MISRKASGAQPRNAIDFERAAMTGTSPRKARNDGTSSLGDLLAHGALEHCAAERPTIGERPRQPVDLVNDDDVDPAGPDIGEQVLQRRPLHMAAENRHRHMPSGQRGSGGCCARRPSLNQVAISDIACPRWVGHSFRKRARNDEKKSVPLHCYCIDF